MKIDRLLGIVIYLLNRKMVSARELSEHFEVSVRTIQRDIDSLSAAGIPIYASQGATGGYGILENYTLNKQIITADDFFYIFTALKTLGSAYENKKILRTIEKIKAIYADKDIEENDDKTLYIDFAAFGGSRVIKKNFPVLEQAIKQTRLVEFDYTTSNHNNSHRTVEPLALAFKWYSWYLLTYCRMRSDYRIFAITRIRNLKALDEEFTRKHIEPGDWFNMESKKGKEESMLLRFLFDGKIKVAIENIFTSATITKHSEDTYHLETRLPKNEQFWLGVIMSFGKKITILEPLSMRERLIKMAEEVGALYS